MVWLDPHAVQLVLLVVGVVLLAVLGVVLLAVLVVPPVPAPPHADVG